MSVRFISLSGLRAAAAGAEPGRRTDGMTRRARHARMRGHSARGRAMKVTIEYCVR